MKKTILTTALVAAMGITGAQAADLTGMSITNGGFAFASGVSATSKYTHFFDSSSTVATTYSSNTPAGDIVADGSEQGKNAFTGGFIFSGYVFSPTSLAATGTGTDFVGGGIDGSAVTGDDALTMSEFNWSGFYGASLFPLSPDAGFSTNTLTQGGACSEAAGGNTACYTLRWEHFIQPQGGFSGDTVWELSGVATFDTAIDVSAVPVPAAVWLFGSGLVGLAGVARRRRNA